MKTPGFTLIELLVAFTILALIGIAAFSGLGIALSAWTRGNEFIEELRDEQLALALLRGQIRAAQPFLTDPAGPSRQILFRGTATTIEFVSDRSMPDGPGSTPRGIRASWERPGQSESGHLVLSEHRILPPENRMEDEPYWRGELMSGASLEFRFLRAARDGAPPQWLDAWDGPAVRELPAAVAILVPGEGPEPGATIIPLDSAAASREGAGIR